MAQLLFWNLTPAIIAVEESIDRGRDLLGIPTVDLAVSRLGTACIVGRFTSAFDTYLSLAKVSLLVATAGESAQDDRQRDQKYAP